MNYALIAACGAAFLFQLTLGSDVEGLVRAYGFTPREFKALLDGDEALTLEALTPLVTSLFLHGGWFHIIGNLLYLRVFGDNIEDRFGHVGYVLFYLAAGTTGAFAQLAIDPESTIPMIGASGAIAGVLGAYIVMFPRARILTLFPVFIFLTFLEVPAFVFLGIWGAQQLLNGFLVISEAAQVSRGTGQIAWFAHLGGFAIGVLCGLLGRTLHKKKRKRTEPTPD